MTDYKPGSFFLTRVRGTAGYLIGLGEALAADGSRWSHAGLILDADGTVLEAEPGGARLANISEYAGRPLLVSDGPVQQEISSLDAGKFHWPWSREEFEPYIRGSIVDYAKRLVGVPYSPLDYFALAALHLHLPSKWIRQRVQSSGHMICSQLVDAVYARAGVHLFTDGRLPGDVAPADLASWAEDWQAKQ